MDLKLKNKTVFVSGSSKGIGFETAKLFLEEGATVIINGRTEKSVKNALKKLNTPKVSGIAADFIEDKQIDELIKKLPDIDILVNNVGIFRGKNFYDETDKDWKDHIQVNLLGGVKLSKHFLPKMIKKNWGRIIFVSSECATLVPGDLLSYSVSKASVNVFSSGLAKLTKGTNVTVNTIIPGSTLSEGSKIFLKETAKRENKTIEEVESNFFKDVRPSSLLGRFAKVEELASLVSWLVSEENSFSTASVFDLSGGRATY